MHVEYGPNETGRDFIVSDIHGMTEMFKDELLSVNFDYENDRCFHVGDLIDRGLDSKAGLYLANEPWFYTVYGNHEDLFVQAHEDVEVEGLDASWLGNSEPYATQSPMSVLMWVRNGGGWCDDATPEEIQEMLNICKSMPVFITLNHTKGKVGICHAQAPTTDWNDVKTYSDIDHKDVIKAFWGRTIAEGYVPYGYNVDNVDITIHGHTIMLDMKINKIGNSFFIDTGGFGSLPKFGSRGKLTLVNIEDLLEE